MVPTNVVIMIALQCLLLCSHVQSFHHHNLEVAARWRQAFASPGRHRRDVAPLLSMQSTITGSPSSNALPVVKTVLSAMETVKKEGWGDWDKQKQNNNVKTLLELSAGESKKEVSLKLLQKTNGPVPRSYLPTLMLLDQMEGSSVDPATVYTLIEEGMKWYLDCGGRASRIEVSLPTSFAEVVGAMGFKPPQDVHEEALQLRGHAPSAGDRVIFACDAAGFRAHCEARIAGQKGTGNAHTLYDVAGRLAHDLGDPKASIKPYTSSLQANPQSAAVFRNMGSAYHAAGDLQLAFASYQQAVQLDETDALVYLKLAFFYEDFATKDWIDAADHAQKCYEYYLDKVDRGDTSVLTRLGNLLVREHRPEGAVRVYARALELDPLLENVWFNKAHAQMTIGDVAGAAESLRRTLEIDPTVVAARHMLKVSQQSTRTVNQGREPQHMC